MVAVMLVISSHANYKYFSSQHPVPQPPFRNQVSFSQPFLTGYAEHWRLLSAPQIPRNLYTSLLSGFGFEREVFRKEPIAKLPFGEESLSGMLMVRVEKEISNSRSSL